MDVTQPITEKKKTKSFWNRLLHLPRSKSQVRQGNDDSFKRHNSTYSSLHSSKKRMTSDNSSTSGESENFTTIDSSALMELHKDAGILFLNKEALENCFSSKEENKHVQFVPSPMNKYYNADKKSTKYKTYIDENKENSRQEQSIKPARSILRIDKNSKLCSVTSDNTNTQCNSENRFVKGENIDSREFTREEHIMERTSTKIALVDRKNVTLSQLNVSNITRYNSLPRNRKYFQEGNVIQKIPEQSQINLTESLLSAQRNSSILPQQEKIQKHFQSLNAHRQSCYGVSDPSRIFESKYGCKNQCSAPDSGFSQRYSYGGPLEHPSRVNQDLKCFNNSYQLAQSNSFKISGTINESSARNKDTTNRPILHKPHYLEVNTNYLSKQHYLSTGHIPNKAINEVGLPLFKTSIEEFPFKRLDARSKSPQYIPLSETFSHKNTSNKEKISQNTFMEAKKFTIETCHKNDIQLKNSNCLHIPPKNTIEVSKYKGPCLEQDNIKSDYMSETRKKEIKSAMYTQKRQRFRKVCKYKSELCEDGFSSMADDECSFDCSCQTCELKKSRGNKRNSLKNFFSLNKNKYFFTIEPNIKGRSEVKKISKTPTFVENPSKPHPYFCYKSDKEQVKKEWYDCNDSLSLTPNQQKPVKVDVEEKSNEIVKKTSNNFDNLYENITNIINSATKHKLTPQDVKRILSTPIASPLKFKDIAKSALKNPRSLFKDDQHKSIDDSLKLICTPTKNSDCFNDSIILLQEIFQKLSQECKDLLQPNVSSSTSGYQSNDTQNTPSNKYVNDLVKNLKSSEISEADFALIIGGIAQNIFSETKAKQRTKLTHSISLPDLKSLWVDRAVSASNSMNNLCNFQNGNRHDFLPTKNAVNFREKDNSVASIESIRQPDGWSRTPTEESIVCSIISSANQTNSNSNESKESSKYSESDLQLLEDTIRLGMGLSPIKKTKKVLSPSKATKYKSKDVLSGKGKLKLKIYNNSGLVTVFVMKAAKLSWATTRELNSYVKITMVPDDLKRVHWRTNVQKSMIDPIYNQKFSFEVFPKDETNRLVFSVWHRDYAKQRSELIGCMSFSIRSIMDNKHNVDGWYRLLREKYGIQKHFAAHSHKNCIANHPAQ